MQDKVEELQQYWPSILVAGSPSDHNMPHHFHCHHLPSERAGISSKCSNGGFTSHLCHSLPADPLNSSPRYSLLCLMKSSHKYHLVSGRYCHPLYTLFSHSLETLTQCMCVYVVHSLMLSNIVVSLCQIHSVSITLLSASLCN